ncbi:MAG: hypothetical protein ACRD1Y_14000 [Terriglobales bacterium]
MRALLIGGTTFLGPWVARALVARGLDVAVYHRGEHESPLLPPVRHFHDARAGIPVRHIPEDVCDWAPEIVVHMNARNGEDTAAAVAAFAGKARRLVLLSSGDVYRAWDIFLGRDPGPALPGALTETSPLRTRLYPYEGQEYDKILAEQAARSDPRLPVVVLRLPKIYGPGSPAPMEDLYAFREHPGWRWTHGHVADAAAAVALAALHTAAEGETYNVGELDTPTVGERLAALAAPDSLPPADREHNFAQAIVYDTGKIRRELEWSEAAR